MVSIVRSSSSLQCLLSNSLRQRNQVAEETLPGILVEVLRLHLTHNFDKERLCKEAARRERNSGCVS